MNTWEMRQELQKAETTFRAADNCANEIASMLPGRLKKVSPWILKALKKELANYNMHTRSWNQDK